MSYVSAITSKFVVMKKRTDFALKQKLEVIKLAEELEDVPVEDCGICFNCYQSQISRILKERDRMYHAFGLHRLIAYPA